jgi:hypothetical protein
MFMSAIVSGNEESTEGNRDIIAKHNRSIVEQTINELIILGEPIRCINSLPRESGNETNRYLLILKIVIRNESQQRRISFQV